MPVLGGGGSRGVEIVEWFEREDTYATIVVLLRAWVR